MVTRVNDEGALLGNHNGKHWCPYGDRFMYGYSLDTAVLVLGVDFD